MKKIIITAVAVTAAAFIIAKKLHQSPEQEIEVEEVDTTKEQEIEVEEVVDTFEPADLFGSYSTPDKKANDYFREFDENISKIRADTDELINDKLRQSYAESLAELKAIANEYERKAASLTEEIREKALSGEDISSLCDELSRTMLSARDALK